VVWWKDVREDFPTTGSVGPPEPTHGPETDGQVPLISIQPLVTDPAPANIGQRNYRKINVRHFAACHG
jgi:hypothetical protein